MDVKQQKSEAYRNKPKKYPPEIKSQAVELFKSCRADFSSKSQTARHVAHLLGVGCKETVLTWVGQAEVDSGTKIGTTSEEHAEIKRLKKEVAELKRANGILKAASAFFAAELDRPQK